MARSASSSPAVASSLLEKDNANNLAFTSVPTSPTTAPNEDSQKRRTICLSQHVSRDGVAHDLHGACIHTNGHARLRQRVRERQHFTSRCRAIVSVTGVVAQVGNGQDAIGHHVRLGADEAWKHQTRAVAQGHLGIQCQGLGTRRHTGWQQSRQQPSRTHTRAQVLTRHTHSNVQAASRQQQHTSTGQAAAPTWKCFVFPGVLPTPTRLTPWAIAVAPINALMVELLPTFG